MKRRKRASTKSRAHHSTFGLRDISVSSSASPSPSPAPGEVAQDIHEYLIEDYHDDDELEPLHLDSAPYGRRDHLLGPIWRTVLEGIDFWFPFLLSFIIQLYALFNSQLDQMTSGLRKLWGGSVEDVRPASILGSPPIAGTVRRRRWEAGQSVASGSVTSPEAQYFPGMVNLSGTLCYMNSVLQAFASMPSLITHLENVYLLAVEVDQPTPVTDALNDVLLGQLSTHTVLMADLNTPHLRQPAALRPQALLEALEPLPAVRRLLGSGQQQDAHELFLVLAEAVTDEALKVAIEVARSRGLGDILSLSGYTSEKESVRSLDLDVPGKDRRKKIRGLALPWEGLIARRRVCETCGWCEAVRMDTLGGMELPLPLEGETTLDSCIAHYLAPENLSDVTCEMCSLRETFAYYNCQADKISGDSDGLPLSNGHARSSSASNTFSILEDLPPDTSKPMTSSRKARVKTLRKVATRLGEMLESKSIVDFGEPSIPSGTGSSLPIKWQTVRSNSVREGIITRPPRSLRLHLIRSEYNVFGQLMKKKSNVAFPLYLDLTRFVSGGVWGPRPGVLSALSTKSSGTPQRRVVYRLETAVLHQGRNHNYGHYTCIRRKPTIPQAQGGALRPSTSAKSCPDGCHCEACTYYGQVRAPPGEQEVPGKGWLWVSDDYVQEVGTEALVQARGTVFMLIYERVDEYAGDKQPVPPRLEGDGESLL